MFPMWVVESSTTFSWPSDQTVGFTEFGVGNTVSIIILAQVASPGLLYHLQALLGYSRSGQSSGTEDPGPYRIQHATQQVLVSIISKQ